MNTKLLFPHRYKKVGWLLLVPGLLLTIVSLIAMLFPNDSWTVKHLNFLGESMLTTKWIYISDFHKVLPLQTDFGFSGEDLMNEIIMTFVTIGFLLVAFSKEKQEDEYIATVRAESLIWGFYVNIIYFLIGIWLVYGGDFWTFLYWSLVIPPVVFLVRFHWFIYLKPFFEERGAAA